MHCPECGDRLANVQGYETCPDCGYVGPREATPPTA